MRQNLTNPALAITLAASAAMFGPRTSDAQASPAAVPFTVGEELTYRATFGKIPAGTARMRVDCIEIVRGRAAYHLVFTIDGGIPFFRVHDRYESWVDVETLSSLRHRQQVSEGRYRRTTMYEIYPDRAAYQKNGDSLVASVSNPLAPIGEPTRKSGRSAPASLARTS